MRNFHRIKKILSIIFVILGSIQTGYGQISAIAVNPTTCDNVNGSITLQTLAVNTPYQITFQKDGKSQPAQTITSTATGVLIIANLKAGVYSSITATNGTNAPTLTTSITLTDGCIAKQSIRFSAAAYANFVGIQDDDPEGFTQIFARLSVPLNKIEGIDTNRSWLKRIIPLRNIFLQLTYGNTDKFKFYTLDSNANRYVNRLDLYSHAYFNANLGLNLCTFILPKKWKNHTGDMAHIYLDGWTSLVTTNVIDSFHKNDNSTNKTYNIKSSIYGLNLKAIFYDLFESRFSLELGSRVFWIYPLSSSVLGNLNPQSANLNDIFLPGNSEKSYIESTKKVTRYLALDAIVSYTTSADTKNTSNVFLRYSYLSNMPTVKSSRYSNNYFQFQLGYNLDVTKIFANAKGSGN